MNRTSEAVIQNEAWSSESQCAYPWKPDRGDGTFCNPIIFADYSDPDVIRVGNDFYLVASSFNCTPGLPILHSNDLVNWKIINHGVKNVPHARYAEVQPGCGVWAPAMRFHAGKFWIFFPTPDEGIYVITAKHPADEWSEPHLVQAGKGLIDPCPLWDDDGKAYLVHAYAGSRAGIKHRLRVCPMAPDGSRLLGEGEVVFHQPEKHPILEGPKFLKKDGWYYILAPAGGVETGWQVVLRSKNIYGPYEDKIVLHQGATPVNGPHQGALVDLPNGDDWFIHFQDAGLYGRIIHLQPVTWHDGWPIIGDDRGAGDIGQPIWHGPKPVDLEDSRAVIPQTSDEFDSPKLGLQWQWQANHHEDWYSLTGRKGCLRLYPQSSSGDLNKLPNVLSQKFPARSFSVETQLELNAGQTGEAAGLTILGQSTASLSLEKRAGDIVVVLRFDGVEQYTFPHAGTSAKLKVTVGDDGLCVFGFSTGGTTILIQHTFRARKGVWIGAKVGVFSAKKHQDGPSGYADVDYFRFA